MDILLIIAILVILAAGLGFTGVVEPLRNAAWPILVMGLGILVLVFVF